MDEEDKKKPLEGQREMRGAEVVFRSSEENEEKTVSGYAALFNSRSKLLYGWFYEEIEPSALDGVIERSDVFALLNHDQRRGILGRSTYGKGSLSLTIDTKGLKYEFTPPKSALGDELVEGLSRGDIRESSFSFTVKRDSWTKLEDGVYLRKIIEIGELFDVSPVYTPAYEGTEVSARMYEEQRAILETPQEERTLPPTQEYYDQIRSKFN